MLVLSRISFIKRGLYTCWRCIFQITASWIHSYRSVSHKSARERDQILSLTVTSQVSDNNELFVFGSSTYRCSGSVMVMLDTVVEVWKFNYLYLLLQYSMSLNALEINYNSQNNQLRWPKSPHWNQWSSDVKLKCHRCTTQKDDDWYICCSQSFLRQL